tara:strand:+ start:2259 stop:2501 length:243 start_codon:yes stop_codon:yes gene_type:complete
MNIWFSLVKTQNKQKKEDRKKERKEERKKGSPTRNKQRKIYPAKFMTNPIKRIKGKALPPTRPSRLPPTLFFWDQVRILE